MQCVPFNREHLNIMDARDYEAEKVIPYISNAFVDAAEQNLDCYTLIKDGRIITCIGCFELWEGVLDVWQIPSRYAHKYIKDYCKTVKGMLDNTAKKRGARRLQTISPADSLHDRWHKFLGFECEGTLKEYSRFKVDHRMWARRI